MDKYTSLINGQCDGVTLVKGQVVELTEEQAKALGSDVKALDEAPADKQVKSSKKKSKTEEK